MLEEILDTMQSLCCDESLSHVRLFAAPWTAACQAPLSMGFSGKEYWSGLPCPPPGDLPNPGIELRSPALQAYSLSTTHSSTLIWKIPWMKEPGRLQSMGLQRVGHNWATSLTHSLPTEPPGKPKNTVVGSLSLLQGIMIPSAFGLWCGTSGTKSKLQLSYHALSQAAILFCFICLFNNGIALNVNRCIHYGKHYGGSFKN